ncbi:MAG: hypothetical protein GXO12_03285 [Epsilonproteobacteria bacterium]|nr:hypothetical protein [Campylobacterota bacterium]
MNRRGFVKFSALTMCMGLCELSAADEKYTYLDEADRKIFHSIYKKLGLIQKQVGYSNFSVISFDEALKTAKDFSHIGAFDMKELTLMEKIFYMDASKLGFYGDRTVQKITSQIDKKEIVKIKSAGQYLFKGKPKEDYERIMRDIGPTLKLTSGIRSVIKQTYLFYGKVIRLNGNLSLASFNIAPPGYSYHTIRDFDVGRIDWGYANFTSRFATTKEFSKLRRLKYISIRYGVNNDYGVRFEPWHVKVLV